MKRLIKFRAWDKDNRKEYHHERMHYWEGTGLGQAKPWWIEDDTPIMQYTGLKDKNGLQDVYEGDIIGWHGLVEGNIYEHSNLLKEGANLIIEGFGTKDWLTTYSEAVARGCKDAE